MRGRQGATGTGNVDKLRPTSSAKKGRACLYRSERADCGGEISSRPQLGLFGVLSEAGHNLPMWRRPS